MSEIAMSTRTVTVYATTMVDGTTYETTDHAKASRAQALTEGGIHAAECYDCKAVIPVALVDALIGHDVDVMGIAVQNACPVTSSRFSRGHRVSTEAYNRAKA